MFFFWILCIAGIAGALQALATLQEVLEFEEESAPYCLNVLALSTGIFIIGIYGLFRGFFI